MVDLASFREPEEVFLAAAGNPEPLAQRIEDGKQMDGLERTALAAYLRGELVPPKRKRGQKQLKYLLKTEADQVVQNKKNAVLWYQHLMRELERKEGTKHGKSADVIASIAKSDGIEEEALVNEIKRSKNARRAAFSVDVPAIVKFYHVWLHRTGRLEDYRKRFLPHTFRLSA